MTEPQATKSPIDGSIISPDKAQPPEVIVLIHGIRTRANGRPMVARVLRGIPHVVEVYPIKYGYFDVFRF